MIAAIENGILARLRAAEPLLGYQWRTCESFPEDWESAIGAKTEIRAPAAWVTFAGADDVVEETSGVITMTGTFYLLVGAQSARNETAQRHGGSPAEPGSYQLAEDSLRLLAGSNLGLDISRLKPGDLRQVRIPDAMRKRGISVLAQVYTTRFSIEPAGDDSIEPFEVFHANWDIPSFGSGSTGPIDADPVAAGVQIPDDEHADATDHVELEQP
jgi:phage gp37-like protein